MRVPIYEELNIREYDVMSIVDALRKSKVGKGPTYLNLLHLEENETYLVLETLYEALKILKLSAYFPYPLYVLTPFYFPEIDIPTIRNEADLPKHFYNRVKRLNSKELDLVNKINTLSERISNQPTDLRRRELKASMKGQWQLFKLTRQQAFYEHLLEKLRQKDSP